MILLFIYKGSLGKVLLKFNGVLVFNVEKYILCEYFFLKGNFIKFYIILEDN